MKIAFIILFFTSLVSPQCNQNITFEMSMISYCEIHNIQFLKCGIMCERLQQSILHHQVLYDESDNVLLWLAETKYHFYIIYRGTQMHSLINWYNNMNMMMSPIDCDLEFVCCENCKVHSGFKHIQNNIFTNNVSLYWLDKYISNSKEICISGHSLGGALATIHAFRLKHFVPNRVSLHTYGSPRVGNSEFSSYLSDIIDNSYRYVNQYDIIPHIPPIGFSYSHVPKEYWFFNSLLLNCSDASEDEMCSYSVKPIQYRIKDHFYYFDSKVYMDDLYYICMSFDLEHHINVLEDGLLDNTFTSYLV